MAKVTLTWVGGEHDFALYLGNLRAVQKYCDAGPEQILKRILHEEWRVDDLFEVIRQGLIGGGMSGKDASSIVTEAFNRHPLLQFKLTAQAILAASLAGFEDEPVGEDQGVETPAPESGVSQTSTVPAPS